MYVVSVNFHDQALPSVKIVDTPTDLALYLERIPSMLGFEANRKVSIDIEETYNTARLTPLPLSQGDPAP